MENLVAAVGGRWGRLRAQPAIIGIPIVCGFYGRAETVRSASLSKHAPLFCQLDAGVGTRAPS